MATPRSLFCDRFDSMQGISNDDLRLQLNQLAKQKHALDAVLLLYLSELDERGLYREQAFSSLFEFCVSHLGFSEDVAYKRVGVARMLRQFPLVFDLLAEGRIHLSALMLLRPHLTESNHREWLLAASGKSKRQVEKLVATRYPRPDLPAQVRKLPVPRTNDVTGITAVKMTDATTEASLDPSAAPGQCGHTGPLDASELTAATSPTVASPATALPGGVLPIVASPGIAASGIASPGTPAPARTGLPGLAISGANAAEQSSAPTRIIAPATSIQPLSGSSYRVVFTASATLKQKLDRARELLSHAVSPSDLPALIERAIDLLIEREERRRYAISSGRKTGAKHEPCQISQLHADTSQDPGRTEGLSVSSTSPIPRADAIPRAGGMPGVSMSRASRYVPAAVRRAIWQRDQGQCTFTDAAGNRCRERHFLEIEHRFPYAIGGPSTTANCRLMCRSHNALRAEEVFGCCKIEASVAVARAAAQQRS